ncbi:MAG: hypothetical protein WCS72_05640 [Deltaproteobacteria bacterium]
MNRAAAPLLASLLTVAIAACGPTTNQGPLTEVSVYWEFERYTFIDGVEGFLAYDANVNWPPGTGSRACPQSGVDFVTITDGFGNPLTGSIRCVNQSVQGALLAGFEGPNTYVVTGWRNGVAAPLYQGQVTIQVVNGVPTFGTAIAAGIPDLLTVDAILADATSGPSGYPTCGLARIQRFDAALRDRFGSLIWRNPVRCGVNNVPGVSFDLVDRDNLFLWMDAVDETPVVPEIVWSICGFRTPGGFPHFLARENRFSLLLPLGMCTTPPFP